MNRTVTKQQMAAVAGWIPLLCCLSMNLSVNAQTPPGQTLQTVNLVNLGSRLCVSLSSESSRDGVNVQQDTCNSSVSTWNMIDLGGREFAIYNAATGKVLDVSGASFDDGANVQQWSWNGTKAQRWRVENIDGRNTHIVSQNSGKCLDVSNRSSTPGANIAQYRCHGGENQLWQLAPPPTVGQSSNRPWVLGEPSRPSTTAITATNGGRPNGRTLYAGMIVSRATSMCIDVEKGSRDDGANIRQWTCNGSAAQLWDFIDIGRGEMVIVSRGSGKVMDVYGSQYTNGANVAQFTWNGGDNQRWRLEQSGSGFFRIVSVGSSKCIDLDNAEAVEGVNVQQWECHGRENQQWRIEVRGSGNSWGNNTWSTSNFPQNNTSFSDQPPAFAIGTWRGFHPTYGSTVELSIHASGEATAVIDRDIRVNGYFRNGRLFMGTERFEVTQERNGIRTVQVGQSANVVRYSRAR